MSTQRFAFVGEDGTGGGFEIGEVEKNIEVKAE